MPYKERITNLCFPLNVFINVLPINHRPRVHLNWLNIIFGIQLLLINKGVLSLKNYSANKNVFYNIAINFRFESLFCILTKMKFNYFFLFIINSFFVPQSISVSMEKQPKIQIYTHHTRLCDTSKYRGIIRLSQVWIIL